MANFLTLEVILLIILGGILPTFFWLWFWLREDRKKPEPRGLILISFIVGAVGVGPTLFLEALAKKHITEPDGWIISSVGVGFLVILSWAAIEEFVKYISAWLIDFHNDHFDEPVDSMIYLISVALGFSALENILFIIKGINEGGVHLGITTIAMRFLGATLLHVLSSATLGGIIGLSYCKSSWKKRGYTLIGLFAATLLHALFNYFILIGGNEDTFTVFVVLWIAIIVLLLFFEKVKKIVCSIKPN